MIASMATNIKASDVINYVGEQTMFFEVKFVAGRRKVYGGVLETISAVLCGVINGHTCGFI